MNKRKLLTWLLKELDIIAKEQQQQVIDNDQLTYSEKSLVNAGIDRMTRAIVLAATKEGAHDILE